MNVVGVMIGYFIVFPLCFYFNVER